MTHLLLALLLAAPTTAPAETVTADQVMMAHGSEAWQDVGRIDFTFVVNLPDGKVVRRSHAWNLVTGVDEVTTGDETVAVNVFDFDADTASDPEKAAFGAWTNDSYWLLMPLKLADGGAKVLPVGQQKAPGDLGMMNGIELSFDGVGLTPGDRYTVFADDDGVVRAWTYTSASGRSFSTTWSDYKSLGGLNLATKYEPIGGPGPRVSFEDLKVIKKSEL